MAKRKNKKSHKNLNTGTCAYCGAADVAITIEHVFPESWYPDNFVRAEMLTVPACSPCNHRYGQLEERMFLPLVLSLPTDPRTKALVARASRTANPSAGRDERDSKIRRRVGESLLRKTKIVGPRATVHGAMWTRTGRQIGPVGETLGGGLAFGTPVVEFGWENLEPIAIKLLRGCYFSVYATPLPQTPVPWAKSFTDNPQYHITELTNAPGAVVRGGFPFSFVLAPMTTTPGLAAGMFSLWEEIVWWATNIPVPEH